MANASLLIAITSLLISSATALVTIIISVINHRREFDPMIALDTFRIDEESIKRGLRMRNVGRGPAHNIQISVYDLQDVRYRADPIDLIPSNEKKYFPGYFLSHPDNSEFWFTDLTNKNFRLYFHIIYENERERKKQSYFVGEVEPAWYTKISRRKFKKYRKSDRRRIKDTPQS